MTTTARAGAPAPAAGPATRQPDDWNTVLDTALTTWDGSWDTRRVQRLFLARYGRGLFRADARAALSRRARAGLLVLHDQPDHRIYTLKDGTR